MLNQSPELAEFITLSLLDIKAQIVYAVRYEFACTLVDILRHRTTIAMPQDYGLKVLPIVSAVLGTYCGWSKRGQHQAIQAYHAYMKNNCIPDFVITNSCHPI